MSFALENSGREDAYERMLRLKENQIKNILKNWVSVRSAAGTGVMPTSHSNCG